MCLLPQGTLDFSMERPLLLEFLGFFSPADVNFIGIQEFSQIYTCRNNKSQSFPCVAIVHLEMLLSIYVCFSVCVAYESVSMFGGAGDRVPGSFFYCVFEAGSLTKPEADPLVRPENWTGELLESDLLVFANCQREDHQRTPQFLAFECLLGV